MVFDDFTTRVVRYGMQISGVVFDIYDDGGALFGRSVVNSGLPLDEKLASCQLLSTQDLSGLPDRLFGLVATNDGTEVRKFAMHDAGHTASSMLYFEACAAKLPVEVREKVASNLSAACGWYGIDPTPYVEKTALLNALTLGLGVADGASRAKAQSARNQSNMDAFRQAQASGVKISATEDVMPQVVVSSKSGPNKNIAMGAKAASWQHSGDISDGVVVAKETIKASSYALPGRYPIVSPEQVKQAARYFDDHRSEFTQSDRGEFARAVVVRADELGVKLSGSIEEYTGNGYGPYIESELHSRIAGCESSPSGEKYAELLSALPNTDPADMAEKLAALDWETGAHRAYGRLFHEPLLAVYGGARVVEKLAAAQDYTWAGSGHQTSGEKLARLAGSTKVAEVFGQEFAGAFASDPVGIFASMPDPEKIVLSRLCAA